MQVEVVELGMRVKIDTGEQVYALMLKVGDEVVEAQISPEAFEKIFTKLTDLPANTASELAENRNISSGNGNPAKVAKESYNNQASSNQNQKYSPEVDEDGFEAGDG